MTEYIPKVWQEGDPITDIDLNRIEERIAEIQSQVTQRVWLITDGDGVIIDEGGGGIK